MVGLPVLALAAVGAPAEPVELARPIAQGADTSGTGWALQRVHLDVTAHPDSGPFAVAGSVTVSPPPGGSRRLLLVVTPGMRFDSARAGAAAAALSANGDTATLTFAEPHAAGAPVVVGFRAHAPTPRVARSIALDREGTFASWYGSWYPWPAAARGSAPDMAGDGRLRIVTPARWRTLSNGRLMDSASGSGWRRKEWASDRPLAWSVIAADYHVRRVRVGSTDVGIYVMPRQAPKADALAAAIPPMVDILSRAYGPYPFATFGLAAIPAGIAPPAIGGRSENGYFLAHEHSLDTDSVATWLFAHELAHMWWANTVISDPPGDDMVDEGLAAHAAVVVLGRMHGRAAAREYLRQGTVPNSGRTFYHLWRIGADQRLMDDFATLPSYTKGAWVYEMLRDRVGDSLFFATLQRLVRERAGRSTTLPDIRAAFLGVAPEAADLERFFADWLDRPGAPVLSVRWSPAERAGRPAVRLEVVQHTAPYRLPLEVSVASPGGARRSVVHLTDSVQAFVVAAAGRPTGVTLDPDHRLLLWEPAFGPVPGVTPPIPAAATRDWLRADVDWLRQRYGVGNVQVALVNARGSVWTATSSAPVREGSHAARARHRFTLRGLASAASQLVAPAPASDTTGVTLAQATDLLVKALSASSAGAEGRDARLGREIRSERGAVTGDPLSATVRGGMDFRLRGTGRALRISHVDFGDGQTVVLVGHPESGRGAVVMASDDRSGLGLAVQILQRIAVAEGWPDIPGK